MEPTENPHTPRPEAPPPPTGSGHGKPTVNNSILGVPIDTLAGLSVEELYQNKTAITMLVHYYKNLLDDNMSIKNQLNTYTSYKQAYAIRRHYTFISALLFLCGNTVTAFGVNILTSASSVSGIATFSSGLLITLLGTFFSFRSDDQQ